MGQVERHFLALSFYAWIKTNFFIFVMIFNTTNMILMLEKTSEETRSSSYMLEYDFLLLSLIGLDYCI